MSTEHPGTRPAAIPRPVICLADIKPQLHRLSRRGLLRGALSLGSLALLSGCDLTLQATYDYVRYDLEQLLAPAIPYKAVMLG